MRLATQQGEGQCQSEENLHHFAQCAFHLPEGWTESDSGTLYLLGEQRSSPFGGMVKPIYRPGSAVCGSVDGPATCTNQGELVDAVAAGFIADCCSAEVRDGKIVTPPIPRLGWVGIKKN